MTKGKIKNPHWIKKLVSIVGKNLIIIKLLPMREWLVLNVFLIQKSTMLL